MWNAVSTYPWAEDRACARKRGHWFGRVRVLAGFAGRKKFSEIQAGSVWAATRRAQMWS
jgi:hypothetical protein